MALEDIISHSDVAIVGDFEKEITTEQWEVVNEAAKLMDNAGLKVGIYLFNVKTNERRSNTSTDTI